MSSETIRSAMRHIDISVGAQMLSLYDLEPGQDRWNPEASRDNLKSNERYLNEVRLNARILAHAGVSALS